MARYARLIARELARAHGRTDEFVDHVYLFAPLRALTNEADAALARLEAEHAQAEARIAALQAALTQYEARERDGDKDGLAEFSQAFDDYAAFYREHMRLEERETLPLLRQHFSADETLCLFDGMLMDDELYELWSGFADDVRIVMISDSCHRIAMA